METTLVDKAATTEKKEGKQVAPMMLSETLAIRLNDLSNLALIVGLVIGVVATAILVWTGGVKEEYLKRDLAVTNERAANANARAAKLENDAAQARLELEKLKEKIGPRKLNRVIFHRTLEGQPKEPVEILYLRDDPDSLEFAQEIENDLKQAEWTVVSREPIPSPREGTADANNPITMSVGGQPSGVTVVAHSVSEEESQASWNAIIGKDWVKTPWTTLAVAFQKSMGESKGSSHPTCPNGVLRIIVGPRP